MICHNYPDFRVWGGIWGILPEAANAAQEFFGSLDHVLQEKQDCITLRDILTQ